MDMCMLKRVVNLNRFFIPHVAHYTVVVNRRKWFDVMNRARNLKGIESRYYTCIKEDDARTKKTFD